MREKYNSEKVKFSGLKQFVDGVPTSYTGCMIEPYSDKPDSCGSTFVRPDDLRRWVLKADKEGFRIRLHACGDGAIRLALDCFEEAQKVNGVRDSRHEIEHVEIVHPDDIERLQSLVLYAQFNQSISRLQKNLVRILILQELEKKDASIHGRLKHL